MPSAGDLRERIRFEARSSVTDDFGNEQSGPWTAQFERAAQFIMRPGSESAFAARLAGRQPVTVITRYDSETRQVTAGWRVVDLSNNRVYAVQAPPEDMERTKQWISFVCETGAGD